MPGLTFPRRLDQGFRWCICCPQSSRIALRKGNRQFLLGRLRTPGGERAGGGHWMEGRGLWAQGPGALQVEPEATLEGAHWLAPWPAPSGADGGPVAASPAALPLLGPGVPPLSWRGSGLLGTKAGCEPAPPLPRGLLAGSPCAQASQTPVASGRRRLTCAHGGSRALLPGRLREPRAQPSCSVPPQLPQPGATWDAGLAPNPDQLSRGRGPSGRGCPWTYSPTPRREAKVLLGLGVGMAAEPGQQEEGRWERERAPSWRWSLCSSGMT